MKVGECGRNQPPDSLIDSESFENCQLCSCEEHLRDVDLELWHWYLHARIDQTIGEPKDSVSYFVDYEYHCHFQLFLLPSNDHLLNDAELLSSSYFVLAREPYCKLHFFMRVINYHWNRPSYKEALAYFCFVRFLYFFNSCISEGSVLKDNLYWEYSYYLSALNSWPYQRRVIWHPL
jgi:hypothetical protein